MNGGEAADGANAAMVAINEIENLAAQIARRFKPERIILFGSHAYGTSTPDSDVDILVVMPHNGDPLGKAVEIRCAIDRNFSLDVLVRSPDELQWRLAENDWFTREIVEKGRVLHQTEHWQELR